MDEKYNLLLNELSKKENTHPQLIYLWKSILKIKKQNMENMLEQCEYMLNNIESISDIDSNSIITLLHIFQNNT